MIRFLSDEDFNNAIVRGLRLRLPGIDIERVQDAGLRGRLDEEILEYAAQQGRVLLTHDVTTLITLANARVESGAPMPGVFAVNQRVGIGRIIEDVVLIVECSAPDEWTNVVHFLPL